MSAGGHDKPRVVFLINSLTGGGAERIMARLITHSMAHSHHYEMHLVLLDKAPEAYSVPDWIAVHRLGTAVPWLPASAWPFGACAPWSRTYV